MNFYNRKGQWWKDTVDKFSGKHGFNLKPDEKVALLSIIFPQWEGKSVPTYEKYGGNSPSIKSAALSKFNILLKDNKWNKKSIGNFFNC